MNHKIKQSHNRDIKSRDLFQPTSVKIVYITIIQYKLDKRHHIQRLVLTEILKNYYYFFI